MLAGRAPFRLALIHSCSLTMDGRTDKRVTIGVLLAGGGARRAGVDKRFLVLEGRTLLQRNLAFLHSLFPTVVLSLAPGDALDLGDAAALGETVVVNDDWPGSSPLAGIATALDRYRAPLFALAVDVAFPSRSASERVLAAVPGHDAAVPVIGQHYQPLFAVYGPGCLEPMTAMLERRTAAHHRRLRYDRPRARRPSQTTDSFHGINTMDDYRRRATGRAAATGRPPRPTSDPPWSPSSARATRARPR